MSANLNPVWEDQAFSFADVAEGETLTVRVFDYDYIGADDPLGELQVPMLSVVRQFVADGASGASGAWFKLTGDEAGQGEIKLGFEFASVPEALRQQAMEGGGAADDDREETKTAAKAAVQKAAEKFVPDQSERACSEFEKQDFHLVACKSA